MPKITVSVTANASKSGIVSRGPGPWKIRLAAPPVEGKANEELFRVLADEFDCARSNIRIVSGATSKTKIVEVP